MLTISFSVYLFLMEKLYIFYQLHRFFYGLIIYIFMIYMGFYKKAKVVNLRKYTPLSNDGFTKSLP